MLDRKVHLNVEELKKFTYKELLAMYGDDKVLFRMVLNATGIKEPITEPTKAKPKKLD